MSFIKKVLNFFLLSLDVSSKEIPRVTLTQTFEDEAQQQQQQQQQQQPDVTSTEQPSPGIASPVAASVTLPMPSVVCKVAEDGEVTEASEVETQSMQVSEREDEKASKVAEATRAREAVLNLSNQCNTNQGEFTIREPTEVTRARELTEAIESDGEEGPLEVDEMLDKVEEATEAKEAEEATEVDFDPCMGAPESPTDLEVSIDWFV